ncbi:hypothetical protein BRC70_02160 [Halobacteriales archaeon QH_6_68_27]|nr:MAG: hypothetical protein BRC70_02160 [Halobacteriales archaeon QH_6_68_27]
MVLMKLRPPTLSRSSEPSETEMDRQFPEAITDAVAESNDWVIEIRPAGQSKGRGTLSLVALVAGVVAVGYWLQRSQRPTETLRSAASETAEKTKQGTEQAADTIEESGEEVAERVEEGSQKASEQVEQTGEKAAEETEEAGETAAEKADEFGSQSTSSTTSR